MPPTALGLAFHVVSEDRVKTWQEVNGDETLALDWPIDENSHVWEIGGFTGRWAKQMAEKYNPFINIFEPQVWLCDRLQDEFRNNHKVFIHPYGLWTHDTLMTLWEHDTDGASVMLGSGRTSKVCSFLNILRDWSGRVDVCLMNIEGAEYVLIPHMIGLGLMADVRFFWCQFHPGLVYHGELQMAMIRNGMERTHKILWDYYPTAVAWERR